LYAQGIELYIEPKSASGRADLISSQIGEERLLLDAKIFSPKTSRGKDYVAKGFNQIYTYALDFNEPLGYLVVFQVEAQNITFSLPQTTTGVPFFEWNNKTVFFIVVDISDQPSASKRGKYSTFVIDSDDLIATVRETEQTDVNGNPCAP